MQQATSGQPDVLAELCRDFVAEARSTVLQLRQALADGDAQRVRDRAHYVKGSSMMLGAQRLSLSCATLEAMGRNADLSGAEVVLEKIWAELKEVEAVLAETVGPAALPAEGSAA